MLFVVLLGTIFLCVRVYWMFVCCLSWFLRHELTIMTKNCLLSSFPSCTNNIFFPSFSYCPNNILFLFLFLPNDITFLVLVFLHQYYLFSLLSLLPLSSFSSCPNTLSFPSLSFCLPPFIPVFFHLFLPLLLSFILVYLTAEHCQHLLPWCSCTSIALIIRFSFCLSTVIFSFRITTSFFRLSVCRRVHPSSDLYPLP